MTSFKEYTKSLKLTIHVASNLTYSEVLLGKNGEMEKLYNSFTEKLADYLNVDYNQIRPVINLFVATVNDCAVWEH